MGLNTRTKTIALLAVLAFAISPAAAQSEQASNISANEGLISFAPSSPFYPVELTVDSITQSPEQNMVERSQEYRQAVESGSSEAAKSALSALNETKERVPAEASEAIGRAIENVESANQMVEDVDTGQAVEELQDRKSQLEDIPASVGDKSEDNSEDESGGKSEGQFGGMLPF